MTEHYISVQRLCIYYNQTVDMSSLDVGLIFLTDLVWNCASFEVYSSKVYHNHDKLYRKQIHTYIIDIDSTLLYKQKAYSEGNGPHGLEVCNRAAILYRETTGIYASGIWDNPIIRIFNVLWEW